MSSPLSIKVTADTAQAKSQLESLKSTLNELNQQALAVSQSLSKQTVNTSAKQQGQEVIAQLKAQQAQTKATAQIAVEAEKTKQQQLRLTTQQLRNNAKQQAVYTKNIRAASGVQGELVGHIQGTRYALYEVAAAYGAAATAALGFVVGSVKVAAAQEQAFAQVERTTEGAVAALAPLFQDLQDMTRVIPESFENLSKIAALGAQLGFSVDQLEQFTETVAKYSASTGVLAEDAATSFGKLSNLLHVNIQDFDNLGSAIAKVGVESVATDQQIAKTAQELAGAANSAGLSTQATIGLGAAFASLAVQPERARSSILRLFKNVSDAIIENGDDLKTWARLLDLTTNQLADMVKTDPDAFFQRFITSMSQFSGNAVEMNQVLELLGVNSVRDIDAFTRLAGSADLMTDSINTARIAYAQGTFIDESSAKVFDTVSSKLTELGNAFKNTLASFTSNEGVNTAIKWLIEQVTNVLALIGRLPSSVKTGIVVFGALLGLFALYKAAMAAAMASTLAFQFVFQNGLKASSISAKGLLASIRNVRMEMKANQVAAGQMSTAQVAGARAATAAYDMSTAALARNLAAVKAGTAAAGAGAGVAGAAGAAGATGALSKVGGFLKSFGGFALISAGVSIVSGLIEHIQESGRAAEIAEQKMEGYRKAAVDAVGGSSALSDAFSKDAQALKEAGNAAEDTAAKYGTVTTEIRNVSGINADMVKVFTDASGASRVLSTDHVKLATDFDAASLSSQALQKTIDDTTKAYESQTTVIGEHAAALQQDMFQQQMNQLDPSTQGKIREAVQENGLNLGQLLTDAMTSGLNMQDVDTSQIQKVIDKIRSQAASFAQKPGELGIIGRAQPNILQGMSPDDLENVFGDPDELNAQADALESLMNILQGTNSAFINGAIASDSWSKALGAGTPDIDRAAGSTETLADKLRDAATEFTNLIDGMMASTDAAANVAQAYNDLGESIAKNGDSFDIMTEKGRQNMAALSKLISAQSQMLGGLVETGKLTQEQAASQMQQYMIDLINQLGNIGVPTEQLDFLTDYLNQIVSHQWQANMGVDISGVVAGANAAAKILSRVSQMAAVAFNGTNTFLNTSTLAGVRAASSGRITTAGQAFSLGYGGQTSFGGPSSGALNTSLLSGYSDGLNKLADAQNKAAGGAKKNNDALEQQQKLLKDTISYFDGIGKSMFTMVDAEGSVFEALQKLGQSISENGTRFNTVTDDGRKNFSALEAAFSDYGTLVSKQLEAGTISAQRAQLQMQQFASGVYLELIHLGVPMKDIQAFFKGMGADTSGWTKAGASVKQFGGYVTAAAQAVANATDKLKEQQQAIKDYVSRLSDAFSDLISSQFGQQNALDATSTAYNRMADAIKDVNDQLDELNKQNGDLASNISKQQAIANGAGAMYAQAIASGDTQLAAIYGYRRDTALAQVADLKKQQQANRDKAAELQKTATATEGDTQAAIDNRKAIQDLLETYEDQIEAYAKSGKTQEQVAKFAEDLKNKFADQLRQLGFNDSQVKIYTQTFQAFINKIREIPDAKVTVTADTSAATAALNAMPKTGTYNTVATVSGTADVRRALDAIPKAGDYKIKPSVDGGSAAATAAKLDALAKPRYTSITVSMLAGDSWGRELLRQAGITNRYMGGKIPGFSDGGKIPGTPPLTAGDNLLVLGPNGPIAVRSGEWFFNQRASQYYGDGIMSAMNEMRIPRERIGSAPSGGSVSVSQGGNIQITNHYPQAEPTSVTINRARQMQSGIRRLG